MSRGAVSLSLSGVSDVTAAMSRAAERSPGVAAAVIEAGLERIARDARGYSPVDSGDQRSTVRVETDDAPGRIGGAVLVGGIPGASGRVVDYADVNELGNRAGTHPVNPSLTPAFEDNRARIVRELDAVPAGSFS